MKSCRRRAYLKALEKRVLWLTNRTIGRKPEEVSYDRLELAALKWVLEEVRAVYSEDMKERAADHGGEG